MKTSPQYLSFPTGNDRSQRFRRVTHPERLAQEVVDLYRLITL